MTMIRQVFHRLRASQAVEMAAGALCYFIIQAAVVYFATNWP